MVSDEIRRLLLVVHLILSHIHPITHSHIHSIAHSLRRLWRHWLFLHHRWAGRLGLIHHVRGSLGLVHHFLGRLGLVHHLWGVGLLGLVHHLGLLGLIRLVGPLGLVHLVGLLGLVHLWGVGLLRLIHHLRSVGLLGLFLHLCRGLLHHWRWGSDLRLRLRLRGGSAPSGRDSDGLGHFNSLSLLDGLCDGLLRSATSGLRLLARGRIGHLSIWVNRSKVVVMIDKLYRPSSADWTSSVTRPSSAARSSWQEGESVWTSPEQKHVIMAWFCSETRKITIIDVVLSAF